MLTISEIINELNSLKDKKPLDKNNPVDADWDEIKSYINSLPANFENEIREYLMKVGKRFAKSYKAGRCRKGDHLACQHETDRLSVRFGSFKSYELQILAYRCPQHGFRDAWYIAFDEKNNRVYRRELITR